MKVFVVAPLVAPVNDAQPQIGGAQVLLADLCRALAARGHAVTLIAPRGSAVRGVEVADLGIDAGQFAPADFASGQSQPDADRQAAAFARVRDWLAGRAGPGSIVHAHAYDAPAFEVLRDVGCPVVHTLHLPPIHPPVVRAVAASAPFCLLATVSEQNADQWRAAGVRVDAVVANGIDVGSVPFGLVSQGYLLFAGRITPEKGPDLALDFAAAAKQPLVLAGGAYDRAFYLDRIAGRVRHNTGWRPSQPAVEGAIYVGPRPRDEIWQLMAGARAVLMPARWDEPFGLVAIEAQAAGAPVIAFARGGLREVVDSGRTGWLIPPDDAAAFVAALARLDGIDRATCRDWVQRRYSLEAMAAAYERLYERAAERAG